MELGYHVTLVRDATAARSREALQAAMDIDGPTYTHAILTTAELLAALRLTSQASDEVFVKHAFEAQASAVVLGGVTQAVSIWSTGELNENLS